MLRIPLKMEWTESYPKGRKGGRTLDPEAWEKMANPDLIRMLATVFIVPAYILALLLIILALCSAVISASPKISPPLIHQRAAWVPAAAGGKSVAFAGTDYPASYGMETESIQTAK